MSDRFEHMLKAAYKNWSKRNSASGQAHPDEEAIVSFLEQKLSPQEYILIEEHFAVCPRCAEELAFLLKTKSAPKKAVPRKLLLRARSLFPQDKAEPSLEILLRLKGAVLELINTSGNVLLGQELLPAPVLRSRKINDFKDEVTILKDFAKIRVEVRVRTKTDRSFCVTVLLKDPNTGLPLKDLRVSLKSDHAELESYVCQAGSVVFEHVLLGRYAIEITNLTATLAAIAVEIKR